MTRLQSLSDAPNTAREYEMIYVLRPNTTNEQVAEVNTRVKGVIETMGGKVIKVDNWGKRRLAYEVSKERKGIYLFYRLYLATPGIVEEAERNLRMLDSVIRFLSVKVEANIDVAARPSEIDEQSYEKAATTAADEDMFLSRGAEETPEEEDDYSNYTGGPPIIEGAEPAAAVPAPAPAPAAEPDAEKE